MGDEPMNFSKIIVPIVLIIILSTLTPISSSLIPGILTPGNYRLGNHIKLLHMDMRYVDYFKYIGNNLLAVASSPARSLFLINITNGKIVAAIVVGYESSVTNVELRGDRLIVLTDREIFIYYLNSTSKNIYYYYEKHPIGGLYAGNIGDYYVIYNSNEFFIVDPLKGKIIDRVHVTGKLLALRVYNDEIFGVRVLHKEHKLVLSVWRNSSLIRDITVVNKTRYDIGSISLSPDRRLVAIILESLSTNYLVIVDLAEKNAHIVLTDVAIEGAYWLDNTTLLLTRGFLGFIVYSLSSGKVYFTGNKYVSALYLGNDRIVYWQDGVLRLAEYNNGKLRDVTILNMEYSEHIKKVKLVGGFYINHRICLGFYANFDNIEYPSGGVACFDLSGKSIFTLYSSYVESGAGTYDDYIVEYVYNQETKTSEVWIEKDGSIYRIPAIEGEFRLLCIHKSLIAYIIRVSQGYEVFVYNYVSGEKLLEDKAVTINNIIECGVIGDYMVLAYYNDTNGALTISMINDNTVKKHVYDGIVYSVVIGNKKVYVVFPNKIIAYDPVLGKESIISSDKLLEALGANGDAYFLACAITSKGLYVQAKLVLDSSSYKTIVSLMDPDSLSVIRAKIYDQYSDIPRLRPVPLGEYVLTYIGEERSVLSIENLEIIWKPSYLITACSDTGEIYSFKPANETSIYADAIQVYEPDGKLVKEAQLPFPIKLSSVPSNMITCGSGFLVFRSGDYTIIYDEKLNTIYAIRTGIYYYNPTILHGSDTVLIPLPIGMIMYSRVEHVSPPTSTTTTTTTTITTSTTTTSPNSMTTTSKITTTTQPTTTTRLTTTTMSTTTSQTTTTTPVTTTQQTTTTSLSTGTTASVGTTTTTTSTTTASQETRSSPWNTTLITIVVLVLIIAVIVIVLKKR